LTETASDPRDFPAATAADWRAKVEAELAGRDFDRSLVSELAGVGRVEPLYTAEDTAEWTAGPRPGVHPFLRGSAAERNRWALCPIYDRWSPEEVQREIVADLRGGADGILLRFDRAVRRGTVRASDVGRDGIALYRIDDFRSALDDVHIEMIQIRLEAGGRTSEAASLLLAIAKERGLEREELALYFGFDLVGTLAEVGSLPRPLASYDDEMAALCRYVETHLPRSRSLAVSSRAFHNAGADPALELACVLGSLAETLRRLGAAGVSPERVARQTELSVSIGNDLFVEVAKLRALRLLWSRMLEACGSNPVPPTIHAQSSERSLSVRDPWVNMLRVTSHAVAAAVGGVQAVSTAGFDRSVGDCSELARRVARNTQLILGEESGLSTVVDPAGGSYFVESLTRQMAESAWSLFQEIEAGGGILKLLLSGELARRIEESWSGHERRLATRELAVTGVSAFPNLGERRLEAPPSLPPEEAEAIATALDDEPSGVLQNWSVSSFDALIEQVAEGHSIFAMGESGSGEETPTLPRRTDAGPFEALRLRGERLSAPSIFLANIGKLAEHKPRTGFTKEALAVAGLEVESGPGTEGDWREADGVEKTAATLSDQFSASSAPGVCLCGTDEQVDAVGPALVRELVSRKAKVIWVAGRPPSIDELGGLGVHHFLAAGEDLLSALSELLVALEVADD